MSLKDNILSAFRNSVAGRIVSVSDLLVQDIATADRNRLKKINDAWKSYEGDLPKPLTPTKSDKSAKDNILLNFAAPIVDTAIAFLVGKGVKWEIDEQSDSPQDKWLTDCLTYNKFNSKLQFIAQNGAVSGDVFVQVLAPKSPGGYPRIVVRDPYMVEAVWAPDDFEHVLQYRITWNAPGQNGEVKAYRQLITEAEDELSWSIQDQSSGQNDARWVNAGEPVAWIHPWCPVLHCQNLPLANSFYGLSDIEEHVVSVNNAINFVVSNMARIIRIHAHPKTWGRGVNAKELSIGIDETILLPSKDASLQNLEMSTDLGSSLQLYDDLKSALHEIARVPEIATGKMENIGQLSGLAMQILFQTLIQKNDTKRLFYGDLLAEMAGRLLEVGGQGNHTVVVQWPDPLPQDPTQTTQSLEADQRMGIVSKSTIAAKRGYNYSTEQDKIAEEDASLGDHILGGFDKGQGVPSAPPVAGDPES